MNSGGSRLCAFCQGVGSIFDTGDTSVNLLNVLEMLLMEQGDLLLEICSSLNEALIYFFEEFDIRFSLDGVLAFFCTINGK